MAKEKRKLINIDLSGCKNMKEAGRIIKYIAEGKLKISVEDLKINKHGKLFPSKSTIHC